MKKLLPLLFLNAVQLLCLGTAQAQSGNYVLSGGETVNFGTLDLATPAGQTWSTARTATPGYFSLYGTATYSGASDASNINGYVKHYVTAANQGATFPVGNGTDLRTLTTSGSIANNSRFATAWIVGDPATTNDPTSTGAAGGLHYNYSLYCTAPIVNVTKIGQWDWQDISATGNGVTITVSLPAGLPVTASASDLRLVGWNGSSWVNLGTAGASGITEGSTLSGTMQNGISAISIGTINPAVPLPLDLVSFTGTAKGCSALLNWATANELNTALFEIEQSTDAIAFKKINQLTAKGFGTASYTFTAQQADATQFYRLKMIDKDGQYKYSNIIKVKTECAAAADYFTVYPNPVLTNNGVITINYKLNSYKGVAQINIINSSGQRVAAKTVTVGMATGNIERIDITKYSSGTYYIQLIDTQGNILMGQKIMKQ